MSLHLKLRQISQFQVLNRHYTDYYCIFYSHDLTSLTCLVGVVKAFIGNISSKMFNAKILKFYVEGENSSHCSSKLANIII